MLGQRKIIINYFSILINRLTQSLTTFILVAFIARILGAYELGQYTLAFSYYFVFMSLVSQGLKTLFTRELARNPQEIPVYLIGGTILQLLFSIIGYIMLAIVVFILPYRPDTSAVCYILGLAIIPFSLSNVTEAIFQAQEKMYLMAISTVPVYILRLLIIIWSLKQNFGINFVSGIIVLSEIIIFLVEWIFVTQFVKYKWHIDWKFMWHTTKAVRTFVVIEGVSILNSRMQVLILSLFAGEIFVGLYSAVAQLMQPFQIIAHSLVQAIFPSLSKATVLGKEKQQQLTEITILILLSVASPITIGLLFFGQDILVLIYHNHTFSEAKIALNLFSFALMASSFIRPLSYLFIANKFEKFNLWEIFITTTINVLLGIILVPKYNLNGAVSSVIAIQFIACIIYICAGYHYFFKLRLRKIIIMPIVISIFMSLIFLILKNNEYSILYVLFLSILIYVFLISLLFFISSAKPNNIIAKILFKKH